MCIGNPDLRGTADSVFSRPIMKVMTRVMSAWKASTCKSNINLACSWYVAGIADRPLHHRQLPGSSASRPPRCGARCRGWNASTRTASPDRPDRAPAPDSAMASADRVEHAAIPSEAGTLLARVRALEVAEQPLEYATRIVLHRQRRRRTLPAERVDVGAAPALSHMRRRSRRNRDSLRATPTASACRSPLAMI